MPTPFNHIVVAEAVLADPGLNPGVRQFLQSQRGPFLFGNTAPDVQVISGQTREATHFFNIPRSDDTPGHMTMFWRFPELARPAALTPDRVAFLTGYVSHLLLDEVWLDLIFAPTFGLGADWGDFRQRLMLHNVLRTHLDRLDFPRVPAGTDRALRQASPADWLPFTADRYLSAWRDEIAGQLAPGAQSRTVEVFAQRMRMRPSDLEAMLTPEALSDRVFNRVSESRLAEFANQVLERSVQLANQYLQPVLGE